MGMIDAIKFPEPRRDNKLNDDHTRMYDTINDLLIPFQDAAYYRGCEVGKEYADIKLRQQCVNLLAVLKDLVFTASNLWDEVKPIKDGPAWRVTHPTIEAARDTIAMMEKQTIDKP